MVTSPLIPLPRLPHRPNKASYYLQRLTGVVTTSPLLNKFIKKANNTLNKKIRENSRERWGSAIYYEYERVYKMWWSYKKQETSSKILFGQVFQIISQSWLAKAYQRKTKRIQS